VLPLGAPCAVGLIVGAGQLLLRRLARALFASAAAAVAVLAPGDLLGEAVFVVAALPLPVLTAVFARNTTVAAWLAAGRT
jgi:hypothetical protein